MTEEMIRCPKCGTENNVQDCYCKECGNSIKKNNYIEEIENSVNPCFTEIITFLIIAIIFAIGFGIFAGWVFYESKLIIDSDYMTLQDIILDHIDFAKGEIILMIGVLIGAMFVFCNWSIIKFNRIEKRLAKIQNTISKKG